MRTILLAVLALVALPAAADVYRWTDKDGVIHYTDKPPAPGAKPAELPPLQTFKPGTPPKLPDDAQTATPAAKPAVRSLAITAPAAETTIRDAEGKVSISVSPEPREGEAIVYTLDGTPKGGPTPSTAFLFDGVERGSHTLGANLVDAGGKTLATAPAVTVYLMPPTVKR